MYRYCVSFRRTTRNRDPVTIYVEETIADRLKIDRVATENEATIVDRLSPSEIGQKRKSIDDVKSIK